MSKTLKKTRSETGLSLKELAKLSGIGRSTLGNYELGLTKMSADKIAHLAKCLKTTPENVRPLTGPQAETIPVDPASEKIGNELSRQVTEDRKIGVMNPAHNYLYEANRVYESSDRDDATVGWLATIMSALWGIVSRNPIGTEKETIHRVVDKLIAKYQKPDQ